MSTRSPIFKTVLVGEGGVGKTSITLRYTEDLFDDQMRMTIGVNFASKEITLPNSSLRLSIWDLGGQPRFRDVVTGYFKGAKFALAVYDITRGYTLERLDDWIVKVHEVAPGCPVLIVGNKTDHRNNGSGVDIEDGYAFASKYGADCVEVSAKSGEGIDEMFNTVARYLEEHHMMQN
jgi:small GTP-binding protein